MERASLKLSTRIKAIGVNVVATTINWAPIAQHIHTLSAIVETELPISVDYIIVPLLIWPQTQ